MTVNRNPPTVKQAPPWSTKMCPVLTKLPEKKLLQSVGPVDNGPEAISCQGPNCMWFCVTVDDTGRAVGGACTATLLPNAIGQLTQMAHALAQKFAPEAFSPEATQAAPKEDA